MSKAAEYGYALYELSAEEELEKEIEKDFAEIAMVFESNQEFVMLLTNPRIPTSERIKVLDSIFVEKVHPYLLSLLKILIEKREASLAPLVFKEFRNEYYKDKNILQVTAISAVKLNDEQSQQIIDKLTKLMHKTIVLENKVDHGCIGGIRIEYPGHMIDASIKNRLKKLQNEIRNADYSQAEV
ncbi:MAG: synthase delta subunit AtpH [Anaerocolumna sp.]|jgi:F-type H+-transporting ATPase subunit delta|nr:synthase delta subunit AtpH [Anaerocolumna sp.]